MPQKATVREAKRIVQYLIGDENTEQVITPFLLGRPGVGKSQIVRAIQKEQGYKYFIDLRLSQHDETDFKLPRVSEDFVRFLSSDIIPTEDNPKYDGSGILFLDEINRGSNAVLQSVFEIVLDRTINNKKIRKDWKIIAAGNLGIEDDTYVTEMDAALKNRFAFVDVNRTNLDEWVEWARNSGIISDVISYLETTPSHLYLAEQGQDFIVTPRSWEKLSRVLEQYAVKDRLAVAEMVSASIIHNAAGGFLKYLSTKKKVNPEDILDNYPKVKKDVSELERGDIHALNVELVQTVVNKKTSKKQIRNFYEYFEDAQLDDNKIYIVAKLRDIEKGRDFLLRLIEEFPQLDEEGSDFNKIVVNLD